MTSVSMIFINQEDEPMSLQVDPWAGFYCLKKGEEIEIVFECGQTSSPMFQVQNFGRATILLIGGSSEYYVVLNGRRIHFTQYLSDRRLCPSCLSPLNLEVGLGEDVCSCGRNAS